jgi:hypothetical protein
LAAAAGPAATPPTTTADAPMMTTKHLKRCIAQTSLARFRADSPPLAQIGAAATALAPGFLGSNVVGATTR